MKQKEDPRFKILVSVIGFLILGMLVLIFINMGSESGVVANSGGDPIFYAENKSYDFGKIKMSEGKVSYVFKIKNTGDGDLKISNINTSCMCTDAIFEANGEKSPAFGMEGHGKNSLFWSDVIHPGEEGMLEVVFDPNAHGPNATGPITRNISMVTNDGGKEKVIKSFTVSGDVIK